MLVLPSGQAVDGFLDAASAAGLGLADAARLVVERELVLRDVEACDLAREAGRHILGMLARDARAFVPLSAAQARYVRSLTLGRTAAPLDSHGTLTVPVPERLLARCRGKVPAAAFSAAAVEEAVSWEIAAALEARSMTEWAAMRIAVRQSRLRS